MERSPTWSTRFRKLCLSQLIQVADLDQFSCTNDAPSLDHALLLDISISVTMGLIQLFIIFSLFDLALVDMDEMALLATLNRSLDRSIA